jgi:Flp pilus assembly pilin Flp
LPVIRSRNVSFAPAQESSRAIERRVGSIALQGHVCGSTKVLSADACGKPILSRRSGHRVRHASGIRPPDRRDERQPSFAKGGIVVLILRRKEGQGLAEYGLILSIIAVLAVFALMFISGNLNQLLSLVGKSI